MSRFLVADELNIPALQAALAAGTVTREDACEVLERLFAGSRLSCLTNVALCEFIESDTGGNGDWEPIP